MAIILTLNLTILLCCDNHARNRIRAKVKVRTIFILKLSHVIFPLPHILKSSIAGAFIQLKQVSEVYKSPLVRGSLIMIHTIERFSRGTNFHQHRVFGQKAHPWFPVFVDEMLAKETWTPVAAKCTDLAAIKSLWNYTILGIVASYFVEFW